MSNTINRNGNPVCSLYREDTPVNKAYYGNKLIFQKFNKEKTINFITSITFSGKSYIDTGIIADLDTRAEMYGVYINEQNTYFPLFGGDEYDAYWFRVRVEGNPTQLNGAYGLERKNIIITYPITGTIILDNTGFTYNGESVTLNPISMYSNSRSIYIHSENRGGVPTDTKATPMTITEFKLYKSGVLVADLKPALDDNNQACLYDTVTNTYKYNIGEGTIIGNI